MNFVLWIVVGGLIGGLASFIVRSDARQGLVVNGAVGMVGAVLAGWLLTPMFRTGALDRADFSPAGIGISLLGAVLSLAVFNLFRPPDLR